jgi:SAM-dependent methyltransferase
MSTDTTEPELHQVIRDHYAAAATRAADAERASCCAPSSCCGPTDGEVAPQDPISRDLYAAEETSALPEAAVLASLGCGNPTALAELREGEVVLDLGSGGGIDVLLSARRVGATGHAYGLDMTDEMLELARANAARAGATNVEFLRGTIEAIPLPDASVDVIISNCVVNLSADKGQVLREAFRVLRPGGRLAISDIVTRRELPADVRRSMELWAGCIAGALAEDDFLALLGSAGFVDASVEPTRVYTADDARDALAQAGLDPQRAEEVDGALASAFVRARKPEA